MAIRTPEVLLSQAVERVDAGDVVSAGCYVRGAVRRHLRSLCEEHGCRLTGRSQEPWDFAMALCQAGVMTKAERLRLNRLLFICWKASHLLKIQPNRMRRTIEAVRVVVAAEQLSLVKGGAA